MSLTQERAKINEEINELTLKLDRLKEDLSKLGEEDFLASISVDKLAEEFLPLPAPENCSIEFVMCEDGTVSNIKYNGVIPNSFKTAKKFVQELTNEMNWFLKEDSLQTRVLSRIYDEKRKLDIWTLEYEHDRAEKLTKQLIKRDKKQKAKNV